MHDFVFAMRLPRVVFGAGALRRLPARDRGARRRARAGALDARPAARSPSASRPARRPHAAGVFAGRRCTCRSRRRARRARTARRARRRLRGRHRRRLDHRARQGDRAGVRRCPIIADPDHLRRQRDDADLRPHRGRPEEDRPRCARAAARGHLRPRAVADPAARHSVVSGINAIAHAAEGLYAPGRQSGDRR